MTLSLTAEQVWEELEKELFGVLGMVNARGEARTVGIVYVIDRRRFLIVTGKDTWKARHIAANPHVSMTVPIPKRIPFLPWIKIPSATITFSGTAEVAPAGEFPPSVLRRVMRQLADDPNEVAGAVIITVTPRGEFVTYGVGIPLMQMRHPARARGRAPVGVPAQTTRST